MNINRYVDSEYSEYIEYRDVYSLPGDTSVYKQVYMSRMSKVSAVKETKELITCS